MSYVAIHLDRFSCKSVSAAQGPGVGASQSSPKLCEPISSYSQSENLGFCEAESFQSSLYSSVGRASDWRSEGPRINPEWGHFALKYIRSQLQWGRILELNISLQVRSWQNAFHSFDIQSFWISRCFLRFKKYNFCKSSQSTIDYS